MAQAELSVGQQAPDLGGDCKAGSTKGMLADLLEREVKREPVNGAAPLVSKELRISDNGLELVAAKDASVRASGGFAVDMGVVGMDNLCVDLGDGAATPKAAHLIAQVDDSGHVQIHLEEDADSSSACNGQSLLDQLEACEVSSSTDLMVSRPAKRPASTAEQLAASADDDSDSPPIKKMLVNHTAGSAAVAVVPVKDEASAAAGILEKAIEMTLTTDDQSAGKMMVLNGAPTMTTTTMIAVNGMPDASGSVAVVGAAATTTTTTQPMNLAPNAPRTFLILQPQSPRLLLSPQGGQRLLLTIPRPGGGVQHVAMPANMVAISSQQLQTNGGVVTLSSTAAIQNAVTAANGTATSVGSITLSSVSLSATTTTTTPTPMTTVAATSNSVASMEGVVTFSGGAVAFPARPAEVSSRNPNVPDNHVTITPVSAAVMSSAAAAASSPSLSVPAAAAANAHNAVAASLADKKRNNNNGGVVGADHTKTPARSRTLKGRPSDAASPSPQPDGSLQYLCEWKDCMK